MSEIKKFFTKLKWEKLVTAIVAIVLGIVCVFVIPNKWFRGLKL